MTMPPTNPKPKSTLAYSKSTLPLPESRVDLGCEELIWVENRPVPPFPEGGRPPFYLTTTRAWRHSNRTPAATDEKIYKAFPLIQVEERPALAALFQICGIKALEIFGQEDAVFADEFAIEPDFAAAPLFALNQHHVPMHGAAVAVVAFLIGLARREMQ